MEHFILEKIDYEKIIAHKDWDGVFGGGLILRLFNIPIIFSHRLNQARKSIIIEVPISFDAILEENLIIDHHDCKKSLLREIGLGNMIICDENYDSVASLIADLFDLEAPNELLDALECIERGEIEDFDLAKDMFIAYVASLDGFPYRTIAQYVKNKEWNKIITWIKKRSQSKEAELIKKIGKLKAKSAETLIDRVLLIKYKANDPIEAGAARLALMEIQKVANIGVALAYEGVYALRGMIATRKKYNLYRVFSELIKADWDAGGRSNVGGFRIPYQLPVNQAEEILRRALSVLLR